MPHNEGFKPESADLELLPDREKRNRLDALDVMVANPIGGMVVTARNLPKIAAAMRKATSAREPLRLKRYLREPVESGGRQFAQYIYMMMRPSKLRK